jgi:hypothetical protein
MGAVLANKLQIRNDPLFTKETRLPDGKIDRRMLSQLGMNITNVFSRNRVESFRPVMLHLSIDASGSMIGTRFSKCLTVATALAYVSTKVRNIDVVVTLRGGSSSAVIAKVFDSRVDNFAKARSMFSRLVASGGTPEGLCFDAIKKQILVEKNQYELYFINFSDGEPSFQPAYYGETAYVHTRKIVNEFRQSGIHVLSYFISSNHGVDSYATDAFKSMYGVDSEFVDVESVTQVLRTLNKKLIVRG